MMSDAAMFPARILVLLILRVLPVHPSRHTGTAGNCDIRLEREAPACRSGGPEEVIDIGPFPFADNPGRRVKQPREVREVQLPIGYIGGAGELCDGRSRRGRQVASKRDARER
ncbi:MAG TPA: hypothetical protein VFS38_08015 [Actinomycetota bacterium]|nr:hypothetical protein [Actinomycetota bacterium]